MKKKLMAGMMVALMLAAGSISCFAFDQWSYSEDVSVYVNGQKVDNGMYKPIIANDRTLVRLVPVFEALGFSNYEYDDITHSAVFNSPTSNVGYRFVAENDKAEVLNSSGSVERTYFLDVPATLQYYDVFYMPIRSFCEITGFDIEWDNATRSVYITNKDNDVNTPSLLTYEEAKAIAESYVNDSDILLGGDTNLITRNGHPAYKFTLRSKSMIENGGSGVMGETVYVYADNGEVEGNTNKNANSNVPVANDTLSNGATQKGTEYFCLSRIVGKEAVQEYADGQHSEDEIISISDNYIAKAVDYHTSNGLKPQKALDLITEAFGKLTTGTVNIEADYVQVVSGDNDTGYHYFRVSYKPNGSTWANPSNVPCYEIIACTDERFSDSNTTGKVLDINNNVIGVAN